MAYAQAAGDIQLNALLRQKLRLKLRVAHRLMLQLRLHLLESQLLLREAAGFAAHAVKLKALLSKIFGNIARLGIQTDAERHAQLFIAHSSCKLRSFLQTADVAVKRAFHVGSSLHNLQLFLRISVLHILQRHAGAVHALGVARMRRTICTITFHFTCPLSILTLLRIL